MAKRTPPVGPLKPHSGFVFQHQQGTHLIPLGEAFKVPVSTYTVPTPLILTKHTSEGQGLVMWRLTTENNSLMVRGSTLDTRSSFTIGERCFNKVFFIKKCVLFLHAMDDRCGSCCEVTGLVPVHYFYVIIAPEHMVPV